MTSLADGLALFEEPDAWDDGPPAPPELELCFVFLVPLVLSSSESMRSNTSLLPVEEPLFLFRFLDPVEEPRAGKSPSKSRTTISFLSPENADIKPHKSTLSCHQYAPLLVFDGPATGGGSLLDDLTDVEGIGLDDELEETGIVVALLFETVVAGAFA